MNPAERFEAIVEEHYQPLFRFAMSLTRSVADAQDLTQHTFLTWATKGHQLRDASKTKAWLFTTMHRAFLMGQRRQTKYVHQELDESAEDLSTLAAATRDPDCLPVLLALARLDKTYQAAVALFYLGQSSYQEIADVLEIPIGTVKSRIARGLQQLRKALAPDEPVPAPARGLQFVRSRLPTASRASEPSISSLLAGFGSDSGSNPKEAVDWVCSASATQEPSHGC